MASSVCVDRNVVRSGIYPDILLRGISSIRSINWHKLSLTITFSFPVTGERMTKKQLRCPACKSREVNTRWIPVTCGIPDLTMLLDYRVPLRHCSRCEFTFLDTEAEQARTQAIAAYRANNDARQQQLFPDTVEVGP